MVRSLQSASNNTAPPSTVECKERSFRHNREPSHVSGGNSQCGRGRFHLSLDTTSARHHAPRIATLTRQNMVTCAMVNAAAHAGFLAKPRRFHAFSRRNPHFKNPVNVRILRALTIKHNLWESVSVLPLRRNLAAASVIIQYIIDLGHSRSFKALLLIIVCKPGKAGLPSSEHGKVVI